MRKGKKAAAAASSSSASAIDHEMDLPDIPILEYEEIMTFDSPINAQDPYDASSSMQEEDSAPRTKRKKNISSDKSLQLKGPMEIAGSVKAGGGITFNGDFTVGERMEAYGNIELNGNMTCSNKVKSFGNVHVNGSLFCEEKVKIFGKLTIVGTFECLKEIEVWGNLTIHGYMKCKTLTAYAALMTIGDESWYEVEETETVHGAKLIQRDDYQG